MSRLIATALQWLLGKLGLLVVILAILLVGSWLKTEWDQHRAAQAALGADAAYASFVMSAGGALSRNEIETRFEGEGVTCTLNGVSLARGRQHMDHTTRIDHAKPRGTSSETYKAVIDDQAHVVFQGRIRVAPDAQKTDAHQLNRSLMLSDATIMALNPTEL